jgi:hypothetical protein
MGLLDKALSFSEQGSLLMHASRIKERRKPSQIFTENTINRNQKKKSSSGEENGLSAAAWLDLKDVTDDEGLNDKNTQNDESLTHFNPSEALSSLLNCIHDTQADLQAPVELFNIIRTVFSIEKGALLLLNHREEQFIGWAHKGYDKTTRSRLRLPYDAAEKLFPEKNLHPKILEHEEIDTLRPYFSMREYSLLEKTYLLPFIYRNVIIGILLVTSSPVLLKADESFFEPFKNVFSTISKIIYHSREEKLNKLSQSEVKPKNLILQQITSLTEQAQHDGSQVYFLVFNFQKLLNTVRSELENIDQYRIQEDILQVVTSMMPENDKIFFVDPHKLLIILSGRYHINEKLFIHQITMALRRLYSSLKNFQFDTYNIITYPDDASRPDEIIKLIFQ